METIEKNVPEKKKTTIKISDTEYPFYRTTRGLVMFSRSKYGKDDVSKNIDAMYHSVYCLLKGCCKHADVEFTLNYEAFIDGADAEEIEAAMIAIAPPKEDTEIDEEGEKK